MRLGSTLLALFVPLVAIAQSPRMADIESLPRFELDARALFDTESDAPVPLIAPTQDVQVNGLRVESLTFGEARIERDATVVEWSLRMRGEAGLDSLVTFRVRLDGGGGDASEPVTVYEDFLVDGAFAEMPVAFERSEAWVDRKGELSVPTRKVERFQDAGTVGLTLSVGRATIDDLRGLPSSVPGSTQDLVARLHLLEAEPSPPPSPPAVPPSSPAAGPEPAPEPPSETVDSTETTPPAPKRRQPGLTEAFVREYLGLPDVPTSAAAPDVDAEIVIATLPDPADSRFAREFDLMLAAIRSGIESLGRGHTLHSHRFHWNVKGDPHRREPGAVIFQSETAPDVVLLIVGEVPGAGVHVEAMHEALRLAQAIDEGPPSILGPTFSGSRTSLRDALLRAPTGLGRQARLVSGTATSATNRDQLCPPGDEICDYEPIPIADPDTACAVLGMLDEMGIDRDEIVLLTEASLYGALAAEMPMCCKAEAREDRRISVAGREKLWSLRETSSWISADEPNRCQDPGGVDALHINRDERALVESFPASIAKMRVESNKRLAELGAQSGGPKGKRATLITEANALGNALPPHAPLLTSRTEEILLVNLFESLASRRPKAVWIVATDPRDKLFLADMIDRHIPNALLVTQESDHLLVHPDYQASTLGMLVFSVIPPRGTEPDSALGDLHDRFANDWSLGAHRAVRRLLADLQSEGAGDVTESSVTRPDAPATNWFFLVLTSLVGAAVLLPIAQARRLRRGRCAVGSSEARDRIFFPALVPGLALVLFVLFDLPHWIDPFRGPLSDTTSWAALYQALAGEPRLWTSFGLTVLGALGVLGVLVAFTWLYAIAPALEVLRSSERPRITRERRRYAGSSILMIGVLTLPLASLWQLIQVARDGRTGAWAERYFAIDSGVSPLVPLALLLGVGIGWVVVGLWRLVYADEAVPPLERTRGTLGVESIGPLSVTNAEPKLVVLFVVGLALAYIGTYYGGFEWNVLRSFEGSSLDRLATVWYVLALIIVLLSMVRASESWKGLQQLTDGYSRRRTTGGGQTDTPWYQPFGTEIQSLLRLPEWRTYRRRWIHLDEAVRSMSARRDDPAWHDVTRILDHAVQPIADEDAPDDGGRFDLRRVARWSRTSAPPRSHHVAAARRVFAELLSRLCDALDIASSKASETPASTPGEQVFAKPNGDVELDDLDALRRLVATELGLHVQRAANRIRALLVFTTGGLVALLFALSAYPFEPRAVLLRFGTIVVVVGAMLTGWVLVRMEKDPMLSWLAGSKDGAVDWKDRSVVGRFLFFEGLPILSVAAAQFPIIPGLLAEWIQPLLKLLTA